MRQLMAIVFSLALLGMPRIAFADVPAIVPCLINSTAVTVCNHGPGTYYGVDNNLLTAQTATVTIYDNASACSGTILDSIGPLGITQQITKPAPKKYTNGVTACASTTVQTPGIEVYASP